MKYYEWGRETRVAYSICVCSYALNDSQRDTLHPRDACQALSASWDDGAVGLYILPEGLRMDQIDCDEKHARVVSSRVRDALHDLAGDDVEFLPIELQDKVSGARIPGYYVMHVLRCLDCVDTERTRCARHPWNQPTMIIPEQTPGASVLRTDAIPPEAKIFRTKNIDSVFVSDDIVKLLRRSKLKGLSFLACGLPGDAPIPDAPDPEPVAPVETAEVEHEAYDLEAGQQAIQSLVDSGVAGAEALVSLIAYCRELVAWDGWGAMAEWDYAGDVVRLKKNWLDEVLRSNSPAKGVKAFWFGIHDTGFVISDGDEDDNDKSRDFSMLANVYIGGSLEFFEDDDSADWACDLDYLPETEGPRALVIPQAIAELSIEMPLAASRLGSHFLPLAYFALALREALGRLDETLREKTCGKRPVVVGYDDGDWVWLVRKAKRRRSRRGESPGV